MGDRLFRTTSTAARRSTGLLIAAALALIMAGVVLWVAVGQSGPQKTAALPGDVVDIGKAPEAIAGSTDPNQIQASGSARLQFADKTDASRLGSELAFEKIDPVGPGYYTLTQPRAWVYLKDGRTLYVRADTGRVKMPVKMQQPESGEFRGHVVLRMFPPANVARGAAVPAIDPDKAEPAIVGVTDSISFDTVLLEITTQDHVTIAARNMLFEGEGLLVRANQVKERIELLKTHGEFVRYNPTVATAQAPASPSKPAVAPTPTAATASAAAPGEAIPPAKTVAAAPAPAAPIGKEQLYKAVFGDGVTVTQTTRKMKADTLEVFARLINNGLPPNAFGVWEDAAPAAKPAEGAKAVAAAPAKAGPATVDGAPVPVAQAAPANEAAALFVKGDEDLTLRWAGPLVLTPIVDSAPPELANGNHFFARFSADKAGGQPVVALEDTATKAKGECAKIEYAATSRMLSLLSGPDAPDVKFTADGAFRVKVPNVRVDLGTGIAGVMGAGQLLAIRTPKPEGQAAAVGVAETIAPKLPRGKPTLLAADQLREISWTDQADFTFRTAGGRISGSLEMAKFEGTVIAHDRTSSISSDSMRVEFAPAPAPGTAPNTLRLMHAEGNVMAIAGPRTVDPDRQQPALDPYMACDKLDVAFMPSKADPNDTDPVRGVATGNVKAASRDASVRARVLETAMARDATNAIVLVDVRARGDVSMERSDGVRAAAEEVWANPVLRNARLAGERVMIGKGPSQIICRDVELDDVKGTMQVIGAGTFEHTQAGGSPQLASAGDGATSLGASDPTRVTATWKRGMLFSNTAGTIDCIGETVVIAASNLRTQTMRSEKLQLWLTPAPAGTEESPGNGPSAAAGAPPAGGGLAANTPARTEAMPVGPADPGERKLLRARAIGASVDREGAAHATIEVRRYSPAPTAGAERVLEQVLYVEGPTIEADDQTGTISVPSAGRAIVRDQRAAGNSVVLANSSGLPITASGGAKGTSRFTWAESMEFLRSTGTLTMKKDVELVHLPLGSQQVTRLVAMKMVAKFNMAGGANNPRSAELVSADASGAVYAESGTQRLMCDAFAYDALRGTAEASAQAGNKVTLFDEKKPPLVAKRLSWDLVKERVEIMEPAPITAPR